MYWLMNYEMNKENLLRFLGEFKCRRCQPSCCQRLHVDDGIILKDIEVENIALNLGLSKSQFKKRFTFTKPNDKHRYMKAPCPMYKDGMCSIHPFRPMVCAKFPFAKGTKVDGIMKMTVCMDCPGAKEIGEKYAINPEGVLV